MICVCFSNLSCVKISAVAALILMYSELTVHPQAGFSLTRSSGLLDLEMELGFLYEHIIVHSSSEINILILRKQLFYVPSLRRNKR